VHSISLGLTSVTWTSMIGLVLGCFTLGLTQWLWTGLERRFFPIDDEPRSARRSATHRQS